MLHSLWFILVGVRSDDMAQDNRPTKEIRLERLLIHRRAWSRIQQHKKLIPLLQGFKETVILFERLKNAKS